MIFNIEKVRFSLCEYSITTKRFIFIFFFKTKDDVFSGLKQNGLLSTYSHLLTGYIGKDSFLTEVGAIVKAIREVNPNIVYGS